MLDALVFGFFYMIGAVGAAVVIIMVFAQVKDYLPKTKATTDFLDVQLESLQALRRRNELDREN